MRKFRYLLSSRKFWAALIGLLLMLVQAYWPDFPLEEEQLTHAVTLLAAYILGVAIDGARQPAN